MNNCRNGQTFVNTCIPAPGSTADNATYVVDLTHYLCGNRKICANGAYPLSCDLKYKALSAPQPVGNDTYVLDVLITGNLTYMPYRQGQNQCGCGCDCCCPKTDNVWATVSVPVTSADIPTITAGEVKADPTNLRDCCSLTNAVSLVGSFTVESPAGNAANNNG